QELKILSLYTSILNLLVRGKAVIQFAPIDDVLELDLIVGGALAGLHGHGFDRDPERVFILDHHARTDFITIDLHEQSSKESACSRASPDPQPSRAGKRPARHPGAHQVFCGNPVCSW